MDDILVFYSNIKEHTQHVRLVLTKLREHGLYAKSEKCEFDRTSVEFLGYVILTQGITMSTQKVKTIQEWAIPTRVRDYYCCLRRLETLFGRSATLYPSSY